MTDKTKTLNKSRVKITRFSGKQNRGLMLSIYLWLYNTLTVHIPMLGSTNDQRIFRLPSHLEQRLKKLKKKPNKL